MEPLRKGSTEEENPQGSVESQVGFGKGSDAEGKAARAKT